MADRRPPRTRPHRTVTTPTPRRDRVGSLEENLKRHPNYDPLHIRGVMSDADINWSNIANDPPLGYFDNPERVRRGVAEAERQAAARARGPSDEVLNRNWRRRGRSAMSDPDRLLPVNRLSEGEYMSPLNQPARGNVMPGDVTDWNERAYEASGRLESRVARQGKTIGSPEMFERFDWFEHSTDPYERGEITRRAMKQSGVTDITDPSQYRKMRLLRDEMLSQDPRTLEEYAKQREINRGRIEERRAYRRADRASRLETRALAEEVAGAQRFARGAARTMGRFALPVAVTGAALAAAEASQEGRGYLGQAEAALKEGLGLDFRNANRRALQNLVGKFGIQPSTQDNSL